MDIQWVLVLSNNFKPFVSNVLARFTNSKTSLGLCEKKYKDYNIPLMCVTNDNLLKTKIVRVVRFATQCTPNKYGAICSQICVMTPTQTPYNIESPSHLRQIHLEAMSSLERPCGCPWHPKS